jgi:homoaconitase/3-isopropylmalate dehydratase large subunit
MARTLLDKVWDAHTVRTLPSGQTQLLIGLHLIHEVTTPQAFQMLKDAKLKVRMPERTSARWTTSSRRPTRHARTPTPWPRTWPSTCTGT